MRGDSGSSPTSRSHRSSAPGSWSTRASSTSPRSSSPLAPTTVRCRPPPTASHQSHAVPPSPPIPSPKRARSAIVTSAYTSSRSTTSGARAARTRPNASGRSRKFPSETFQVTTRTIPAARATASAPSNGGSAPAAVTMACLNAGVSSTTTPGPHVPESPGHDLPRPRRHRTALQPHLEPVRRVRGRNQKPHRARALDLAGAILANAANSHPGAVPIRHRVSLAAQRDHHVGAVHTPVRTARAHIPVGVEHHLDRARHPLHGDRIAQIDEEVDEAGVVAHRDRAQIDRGSAWGVTEGIGYDRRDAGPVVKGAIGPDGDGKLGPIVGGANRQRPPARRLG